MSDHKAIHGYEPAWDLQKYKQEEIARERDERLDAMDEKRKYREAMAEDD